MSAYKKTIIQTKRLEDGFIPSRADFDAVLQFTPMLERLDPDASFLWDGLTKEGVIEVPGLGGLMLYGKNTTAFVSSLNEHGFVQTFSWTGWQKQAEEYFEQPELLAKADLRTCIKLLTLHVRKERFMDGHLGEMISTGHIARILHRLRDLRDTIHPRA